MKKDTVCYYIGTHLSVGHVAESSKQHLDRLVKTGWVFLPNSSKQKVTYLCNILFRCYKCES